MHISPVIAGKMQMYPSKNNEL